MQTHLYALQLSRDATSLVNISSTFFFKLARVFCACYSFLQLNVLLDIIVFSSICNCWEQAIQERFFRIYDDTFRIGT